MERRKPLPEDDLGLPKPWEGRAISRAAWDKHRDELMVAAARRCCRPDGWWLYEKNMQPPTPHKQARILYDMGELKGRELQQALTWWRAYYDDANKMDDRTKYWQWKDIPAKLVKQWDRERRQALQKAGLVPVA
jgi:hypothetical protein